MKTVEEILEKNVITKLESTHGNYILFRDALKAMEEYALQFKSNKLFEFVYCGMTEESSYATISTHRTREGAEKAMNKHKEEARQEWKKKYPVGSYEPYPFGRFEDWQIGEIEVLD